MMHIIRKKNAKEIRVKKKYLFFFLFRKEISPFKESKNDNEHIQNKTKQNIKIHSSRYFV